jgi:hypothetical protein
VSLLLAEVASTARAYLDLCDDAEGYRDPKENERDEARRAREAAIRAAVGIRAAAGR